MLRTLILAASVAVCPLVLTPAAAHTPHDDVSMLAVSPTYDADRGVVVVMQMSEHRVVSRSFDGGRRFQSVPQEMLNSPVLDMQLSPSFAQDGVGLAGTRTEGLWRSADGGAQWARVGLGELPPEVRAVAFDPDFRITGLAFAVTSQGFFRSDDGGLSWTEHATGLTESSLRVIVALRRGPDAPVLFTGGSTLHRSDDGGFTWTALGAVGHPMHRLWVHPEYPLMPVVGAVLKGTAGVRFSTDGGVSFPAELQRLADTPVTDLLMMPSGRLVASSASEVFRAEDLAAPFVSLPLETLDGQSDQTSVHYVRLGLGQPADGPAHLFMCGFEGLFRSENDGDSWVQCDTFPQRVNRAIDISPNYAADRTLALGNFGGGLVLTENGGRSWESFTVAGAGVGPAVGPQPGGGGAAGAGATGGPAGPGQPWKPGPGASGASDWLTSGTDVTSLEIGVLDVSPTYAQDGTIFMAHLGLWISRDRGRSWFKSPIDPGVTAVRGVGLSPRFAEDQVAFFGTSGFGPGVPHEGVYKTTDGGLSWQPSNSGLSPTVKTRDFLFSPAWPDDPTVFLATRNEGIWRSSDGGASWTSASAGLDHPSLRDARLSPAYVHDHTLFAGSTDGGLYVSTDSGASWQPRNAGLPDFSGISVEGIAVSPDFATDRTVFVSLLLGGVWKSTDACTSWQPVNDGLPLDLPRNLAISPAYAKDRTLFLSTHDWVWRSQNGGLDWSRLGGRIRTPEIHPLVTYNKFWSREPAPGSHGGRVTSAKQPADWTEFEFEGDQVRWYAERGPDHGIARVLVDGQEVAVVDTWAPQKEPQVMVFEHDFPSVDWHVLRVEVTATGNRQATDVIITSDGFEYRF